jgi:hypothetical protein
VNHSTPDHFFVPDDKQKVIAPFIKLLMKLHVIDIDETKNVAFTILPECRDILSVYPEYYRRIGFHLPWVGYFFERGDHLVGCGGFKGEPRDGRIEIAYGTFKQYEGQGVGTEICRELVSLSVRTDPRIVITARTLPENNASASILRRNDFVLLGLIWDDEDGNVWEWQYKGVGSTQAKVS